MYDEIDLEERLSLHLDPNFSTNNLNSNLNDEQALVSSSELAKVQTQKQPPTQVEEQTDKQKQAVGLNRNPFRNASCVFDELENPTELLTSEEIEKTTQLFTQPQSGQYSMQEEVATPATISTDSTMTGPKLTPQELKLYPFKTLNRILDDLKWTVPYKEKFGQSLLNTRPIEYSESLPALVDSCRTVPELCIMNEMVDFCPAIQKFEYFDGKQIVNLIRGVIISTNKEIYHFRIMILQDNTNPFVVNVVDKHQYHVIPEIQVSDVEKELLSTLLLEGNDTERTAVVDDAFFKSLSAPNNNILRVTILKSEFNQEDLKSLFDPQAIKERYLASLPRHPDLDASRIPKAQQCVNMLIKVLKGPILLGDQNVRVISLNTSLDAHVDVSFLIENLGFTLDRERNEVSPPKLIDSHSLFESYIRKALELIIIAQTLPPENNIARISYSFSTNLNKVFDAIAEVDKKESTTNFTSNFANRNKSFIQLSISGHFTDDLIIKCFESTMQSNPENKLFYIDALKDVKSIRQSAGTSYNSKLTLYINKKLHAGDFVGYKDLIESLKILGIEVDPSYTDARLLDDDAIIAAYQTHFKDDPRNYQYYNKQLKSVAIAKNSQRIRDYLAGEILPMSLALFELEIEEITEDDVVITAFEFKLEDILQRNGFDKNASEVVLLTRAFASIAIQRKSYLLLNYLEQKLPEYASVPQETRYGETSLSRSYELLGALDSNSDFELVSIFQSILSTTSIDIRVLRRAFRLIANSRNSQVMQTFLETGKIDSQLLPAENWPAGLDNIGNTCYLNSLLQYYFCIKPLRDLILNFDEDKIDSGLISNERKIGGRVVEEAEIKRAYQFIYHLKSLFHEMIHTNSRCVKPSRELAYLSFLPSSLPVTFVDGNVLDAQKSENAEQNMDTEMEDADITIVEHQEYSMGNTEYKDKLVNDHNIASSLLSKFDSDSLEEPEALVTSGEPNKEFDDFAEGKVVEFENADQPDDDDDDEDDGVVVETKQVENIHKDQDRDKETNNLLDDRYVDSRILPISADEMESTIELGRQQDVTECIENVLFQIESALPPTSLDEDSEQNDMVKELFYGKTKQVIQPLQGDSLQTRTSVERFNSLIINVSDHPKSIYDSLDSYFNEDIVNLEDGPVKKSITIAELPQIMQFHVQRVMFDKVKLVAYKSIEPIPFSEKIYLDRYLDTKDEELLRKREQVFQWRREILDLTSRISKITQVDERSQMSIIDSLTATKKFLEKRIINNDKLCIELTTIQVISDQIEKLKQQLAEAKERIADLQTKISQQFNSYNKIGYSIFAIFIHRGEASYGHYWIYIRDPHQHGIFRKYNDEIVSEVPESEVFNFLEGNTATPYYIVYVKDALEKDYINPLNRSITCRS